MQMTITAVTDCLRMGFVFLCLAFFSSPLLAVNCAPDSITLSSQAEVNSFQDDHGPGCDTIVTALTITGLSINDLTPLSDLTTGLLGSTLMINDTSLTSLAGLDGLSSVYWIEVNFNKSLTSIAALSALTSVSGPLQIYGNVALSNLDGLNNLTSLAGGALSLVGNTKLTDLSGVSGLTNIGASLVISNNDALTNLDSFVGLANVAANILITQNDALTDISGLSGLVGFSDALQIEYNSKLANIDGLTNLTYLGGLTIFNNNVLTNVDGLSELTTIGDLSALAIAFNGALISIDGLASLVSVNSNVRIEDNGALSLCSSLLTLLDQVDDALPGPGPGDAGIPDVNGDVSIKGNLEGCNSIEDIVGPVSPCPNAIFCDGFESDGNRTFRN